MKRSLEALRRGQISFSVFCVQTNKDWRTLAQNLLRRWHAPAGVGVEDIEQELKVAAWSFVKQWDPKRGVDIKRYVVFNAMDKAKKWLHDQRNAYRLNDKSPGRFEIPLSAAFNVPDDRILGIELEPDQDELLGRVDGLARTLAALNPRDQLCLLAIVDAEGDLEQAVQAIFNDSRCRLALRLNNENGARRAVRRAFTRACSALGVAAA